MVRVPEHSPECVVVSFTSGTLLLQRKQWKRTAPINSPPNAKGMMLIQSLLLQHEPGNFKFLQLNAKHAHTVTALRLLYNTQAVLMVYTSEKAGNSREMIYPNSWDKVTNNVRYPDFNIPITIITQIIKHYLTLETKQKVWVQPQTYILRV